jgi:hypothetical protein
LLSPLCGWHAASLERALCLILEPDYSVASTTEADFIRAAASAGRQERHRAQLRRQYQEDLPAGLCDEEWDEQDDSACGSSLEQEVHARRELARLARQLGAMTGCFC